MLRLVPVDYDPFQQTDVPRETASPDVAKPEGPYKLIPVDYDPFVTSGDISQYQGLEGQPTAGISDATLPQTGDFSGTAPAGEMLKGGATIAAGIAGFLASIGTGAGKAVEQFSLEGLEGLDLEEIRNKMIETQSYLVENYPNIVPSPGSTGEAAVKTAAYPFEKYGQGIDYIGEKLVDTFASDEDQAKQIKAGTEIAGDVALLGLPKFVRMLKKIPKGIRNSNWYRKATIKERALVVQSIKELRKAGYSTAEIARMRPEFFQQELQKRTQGETSAKPEIPKKSQGVPQKPKLTPVDYNPFQTKQSPRPVKFTPEQDAQVASLLRKNPDMTMQQAMDTVINTAPELEKAASETAKAERQVELQGMATRLQEHFKPGSTNLYQKEENLTQKQPEKAQDIPQKEARSDATRLRGNEGQIYKGGDVGKGGKGKGSPDMELTAPEQPSPWQPQEKADVESGIRPEGEKEVSTPKPQELTEPVKSDVKSVPGKYPFKDEKGKPYRELIIDNPNKNEYIKNGRIYPFEPEKPVKTIKPRTPVKFDPNKHSIGQWVKQIGGINYNRENMKGELDKLRETGGARFVINKKGEGYTLDEITEQAKEQGFLAEDEGINDLLAKLESEFNLASQKGRQVEGREPRQTSDLFTQEGFKGKLTPEEVKAQQAEIEKAKGKKGEKLEGQTDIDSLISEDVLQYNHDNYKSDKAALKVAQAALKQTGQLELNFDVPAETRTDIGKYKRQSLSGIKTHALRITAELAKNGRIDLRGKKVENHRDLAVIAQIYRSPQYETLRYIYVKDGKIVAHEGVTSRLPGTAQAFTKDRVRALYEIVERMDRLGADGLWMVHNHPSGDPQPSMDDTSLTAAIGYHLQTKGKKLIGHVVINSGKYAVMDVNTLQESNKIKYVMHDIKTSDILLTPSIKHPLLGTSLTNSKAVVKTAKKLQTQKGFMTVIYQTTKGKVQAIQEIPEGMLNDVKGLSNYIKGRNREFGAGMTFLAVDEAALKRYDRGTVLARFTDVARSNEITDAILYNSVTYIAIAETGFPARIKETRPKAYKVSEDMPESDTWEGGLKLPDETRFQGFRRAIEDFNIRLKVLNKAIEDAAGEKLPEHLDLWMQKDMLPRKQSDIIRRIRDEKRDFVMELTENNIDVNDLDRLLHAQHAPERNKEMMKRRIKIGKEPEEALSGMTDEEAASIVNNASPELLEYADRVRKMALDILDFEVEQGLVRKSEAEIYRNTYKNYVPLFRDLGETDFTGIGIGAGVDIKGREVKRAKGSHKRVTSPLGNVFYRKERAQIRALKNEVGKAIIELTEEYPFMKSLFKVEREPMAPVGKVTYTATYDKKLEDELTAFAMKLGLREYRRTGKIGRELGYYEPEPMRRAIKHIGAGRGTFSHELAHFFDDKYELYKRFYMNRKVSRDVGREIYKHSEVKGESKNRLKQPKERFANAFAWWMNHRREALETMPLFDKAMKEIISDIPELKPLLNIKPSPIRDIETFTEDVWGRVFRLGENVVGAKIDGAQYFITVNDVKTARALKNLNLARIPSAIRFARNLISIWSAFKTRWRPEFLVTNFQRDLGEALINLGVERSELHAAGKGLRPEVVKGIPKAQKELWQYLRDKKKRPEVDEFFRLGGDTGHFWMETALGAEKSLQKLQKQMKNKGADKLLNPVRMAGKWIDNMQSVVELGVRYSAYKALIRRGMSKQRAIQSVADLTVNFSRQGEVSPFLKSFYGFINPAIQGSSKVIRSISSKEGQKKVLMAVAGLASLGFIVRTLSMLNDEEGDEQIPDWAKNHKLIFSVNGKSINLWNLPYGYTVFYAFGSNAAEVAFGKKTEEEAFNSIFEATVDSFSPFHTNLNSVIPTLAKPLYEIEQNEGWYGGKIYPDQVFTRTPKADYETYFSRADKSEKFTAKALYKMSNGLIDIHPDSLKYAFDQLFGGPFEFAMSTIEAGARGLDGEFDPNKTPFVRQVYRDARPQSWAYKTVYDTLEKAWKSELSQMEKERFYRAVDKGRKEQLFISETDKEGKTKKEIKDVIDDKADGYIQDFIKAQNKMEGPITSEDNAKKMAAMPDDDYKRLLETYSLRTQIKIDAQRSAWKNVIKQKRGNSKVRDFFLRNR